MFNFLRNLEFLSFFFLATLCGMWDLSSLKPCPLHWEFRILTTELPGKSQVSLFKRYFLGLTLWSSDEDSKLSLLRVWDPITHLA